MIKWCVFYVKKFFSRKLETSIFIQSPIENVWKILVDFSSYGLWNPFLPEVSGHASAGSKLKIVICTQNKNQNYTVQIIQVHKFVSLTWLGHFGFPGFIDGYHQFLMKETADGQVQFCHEEFFQGLLVPLVWSGYLNKYLKDGFEQMNLALKMKCETSGIKD